MSARGAQANDLPTRHILHVDMDAFYAAVEQRDNPELRGKPVLVGGTEGRGVVSTASYEARVFGCHSAQPMAVAQRLCPQAIVVPPRMSAYSAVSRQVFAIFERFTPLVEGLSIDEAFLDVTGSMRLFGPADEIARRIKAEIRESTQLTGSVGVAPNKFLAKLASDLQKPDGLVIVGPNEVQAFLDPLPIRRLWGVGKASLPKLESRGLRTFGDIRRLDERAMAVLFGNQAEHFARLVRGLDDRSVVPERDAKSISHEHTFAQDVADREHLRAILLEQTEHVAIRLRRAGSLARCVFIKVRTPDFKTVTRQQHLPRPTDQTREIWAAAAALFEAWTAQHGEAVRLLGMGVSELRGLAGRQMELFAGEGCDKAAALDETADAIRARFGAGALRRGATLGKRGRREVK